MSESDFPIETITIDDVQYSVNELPENVQAAVRKYEEWRERRTVALDEVQLVESALRDLGANIVQAVRAAQVDDEASNDEEVEEPVAAPSEDVEDGETLVVE